MTMLPDLEGEIDACMFEDGLSVLDLEGKRGRARIKFTTGRR